MSDRRDSWMDAFRGLGEALVEVLRAEISVVGELWKRSGRHLAVALAFFAAAGIGFFWLVALLLFGAVQWVHASRGTALWQAALLVALILFLGMAAAGGVGYLFLRRFESPVQTVRYRLQDHLGWWNARLLGERQLSEGETDEEDQTPGPDDRTAREPPPGG